MNALYDFAYSEQGYNHIQTGKICQDASCSYADEWMSVAVVADGHGSDHYPRTDRGARFAVKSALRAIREFVTTVREAKLDISENSDNRLEELAKNILAGWHEAVAEDVERDPFCEAELEKVSDKYRAAYISGDKVTKAYGTTLIAVCQTPDYWFGLQIGDGKCVCIAPDGTISEPIPWDEQCQANITTSICDSDAAEEFRFFFSKKCPIATFIGSDGIDDSYPGMEELYVLYRSVLAIFAEQGPDVGKQEIQEFLPQLSRKGSGDDVSVAGVVSSALTPQFIKVLKLQSEYDNALAAQDRLVHEISVAEEMGEYYQNAKAKAKASYDAAIEKQKRFKQELKVLKDRRKEAKNRVNQLTADLKAAREACKLGEMQKRPDAKGTEEQQSSECNADRNAANQ